MNTLGQTLNIIGGLAFFTAAALWAVGKLALRPVYLVAIAANLVGFTSTWIAGRQAGMALHLAAVVCSVAALALHRATNRAAQNRTTP